MSGFFSVNKWRLLLSVLPLTLLFAGAKVGMHYLGWEPWAFDSLTGALFGSASFIIAFVLSGTLSDYNKSADMPLQIVNSIESIQDSNLLLAKSNPNYDPQPLTTELVNFISTLLNCLYQNQSFEKAYSALVAVNLCFAPLLEKGNPPTVSRVQTELGKIRYLVEQIKNNRDTDFLGPAYALLEVFLICVVIALLLIGADRFSENLVISVLLFTLFTYLLKLIRDLDNPFEYDGKSSVDVDLTSLETIKERLQKTLS